MLKLNIKNEFLKFLEKNFFEYYLYFKSLYGEKSIIFNILLSYNNIIIIVEQIIIDIERYFLVECIERYVLYEYDEQLVEEVVKVWYLILAFMDIYETILLIILGDQREQFLIVFKIILYYNLGFIFFIGVIVLYISRSWLSKNKFNFLVEKNPILYNKIRKRVLGTYNINILENNEKKFIISYINFIFLLEELINKVLDLLKNSGMVTEPSKGKNRKYGFYKGFNKKNYIYHYIEGIIFLIKVCFNKIIRFFLQLKHKIKINIGLKVIGIKYRIYAKKYSDWKDFDDWEEVFPKYRIVPGVHNAATININLFTLYYNKRVGNRFLDDDEFDWEWCLNYYKKALPDYDWPYTDDPILCQHDEDIAKKIEEIESLSMYTKPDDERQRVSELFEQTFSDYYYKQTNFFSKNGYSGKLIQTNKMYEFLLLSPVMMVIFYGLIEYIMITIFIFLFSMKSLLVIFLLLCIYVFSVGYAILASLYVLWSWVSRERYLKDDKDYYDEGFLVEQRLNEDYLGMDQEEEMRINVPYSKVKGLSFGEVTGSLDFEVESRVDNFGEKNYLDPFYINNLYLMSYQYRYKNKFIYFLEDYYLKLWTNEISMFNKNFLLYAKKEKFLYFTGISFRRIEFFIILVLLIIFILNLSYFEIIEIFSKVDSLVNYVLDFFFGFFEGLLNFLFFSSFYETQIIYEVQNIINGTYLIEVIVVLFSYIGTLVLDILNLFILYPLFLLWFYIYMRSR